MTTGALRDKTKPLLLVGGVHGLVVLWLFLDVVLHGAVPCFRDLGTYYYPNYVFLERSLKQGVWPLWNPGVHAGSPCLFAYPVDLLLVLLLGARAALASGLALHLFFGMCGASVLGMRLRMSVTASCACGLFFGLSGYVLSCVNLLELFHAVTWAPWVMVAFLSVWERPDGKHAALLALTLALQLSTLGAETVLQTGCLCLLLAKERPTWRRIALLGAAVLMGALVAAPVLGGVYGLAAGTRRAGLLTSSESLAFSTHPLALLDFVLPRFFGNPHTITDRGFWGQPYFPDRYPYFLSLYMGGGFILLASRAGRKQWRLVVASVVGVLLALGPRGGLGLLTLPLARFFRTPSKFLFLTTMGMCLLAGHGIDRSRSSRADPRVLVWGLALVGLALALMAKPEAVVRAASLLVPELLGPNAGPVVTQAWPQEFLVAGSLSLGVALVLWRGRRWVSWSVVLVALDLLSANGSVNVFGARGFYSLRPEVERLVATGQKGGTYRWFTWSLEGLSAHLDLNGLKDSDVWLYALDRQLLAGQTYMLDGLEEALGEDPVGWAPRDSALTPAERDPDQLERIAPRLRRANVRWLLSTRPLADSVTNLVASTQLPPLKEALLLYELKDTLPRAFWVPQDEVVTDAIERHRLMDSKDFDPLASVVLRDVTGAETSGAPLPSSEAVVEFEQKDPHTVWLRADTPRGYIVVVEGFSQAWKAKTPSGSLPLLVADDRYWALPTPGGRTTVEVQFRPRWRLPAFVLCGVGLTMTAALWVGAARFLRPIS